MTDSAYCRVRSGAGTPVQIHINTQKSFDRWMDGTASSLTAAASSVRVVKCVLKDSRAVAHERCPLSRKTAKGTKCRAHSHRAEVAKAGGRASERELSLKGAKAGGILYHGRNERTAHVVSGADAHRTRRARRHTEPFALTWRMEVNRFSHRSLLNAATPVGHTGMYLWDVQCSRTNAFREPTVEVIY